MTATAAAPIEFKCSAPLPGTGVVADPAPAPELEEGVAATKVVEVPLATGTTGAVTFFSLTAKDGLTK